MALDITLQPSATAQIKTTYLTIGTAYTSFLQDKCFVYNNEIYVLHVTGTAHASDDSAMVWHRSIDYGATYDWLGYLLRPTGSEEVAGGITNWAALARSDGRFITVPRFGRNDPINRLYHGRLYERRLIPSGAFSTDAGSSSVTFNIPEHGLVDGDRISTKVEEDATVGGLSIGGQYEVTVVDANTFTIIADANAASSEIASVPVAIQFLPFYDQAGAPVWQSVDLDHVRLFGGTRDSGRISAFHGMIQLQSGSMLMGAYGPGVVSLFEITDWLNDHEYPMLFNRDLENGVWEKIRITADKDGATWIDGAATANLLLEQSSTGSRRIEQALPNLSPSQKLTFQMKIRANGRTKGMIRVRRSDDTSHQFNASFDLGAETIVAGSGGAGSADGASLRLLEDSTYLLSVTGTPSNAGSGVLFQWFWLDDSGSASYPGDPSKGFIVRDLSIETGDFATPVPLVEGAPAIMPFRLIERPFNDNITWNSRLSEPCLLEIDPDTVICFLRSTSNSVSFPPQFGISLDGGASFSFEKTDFDPSSSTDHANSSIFPMTMWGDHVFAFPTQRRPQGLTSGDLTEQAEVKAFMLVAHKNDIVSTGYAAFTRYQIGNLQFGGSASGVGQGSAVSLGDKVIVYWGNEYLGQSRSVPNLVAIEIHAPEFLGQGSNASVVGSETLSPSMDKALDFGERYVFPAFTSPGFSATEDVGVRMLADRSCSLFGTIQRSSTGTTVRMLDRKYCPDKTKRFGLLAESSGSIVSVQIIVHGVSDSATPGDIRVLRESNIGTIEDLDLSSCRWTADGDMRL